LRSFGTNEVGVPDAAGVMRGGTSYWHVNADLAIPIAFWAHALVPDMPLANSTLRKVLKAQATTASSSRDGEEVPLETGPAAATMGLASVAATTAPTLGVPAATTGEPAEPEGASAFKAVAVGASLDVSGAVDVPRSAVGGSS
jgi:hypothetical protein